MADNDKELIAIVDGGSFVLPYDYYFLSELAKYYRIDFYFSKTKYNYEYINLLKHNSNINLYEYNVSSSVSGKIKGALSYIEMLINIALRKRKYKKIHFMWSLSLSIELLFFIYFRNILIFTFHNDVPHDFSGVTYKPYALINKIVNIKVFVSAFTKEKFLNHYENCGNYFLINHGLLPMSAIEQQSEDYVVMSCHKLIFWGRVEDYKGVDVFIDKLHGFNIEIYGKWNSGLQETKDLLSKMDNIKMVDYYLDETSLCELLRSEAVFILPYKNATQSGVLYTLLAHERVFISSAVGENSSFLTQHGLGSLLFDRNDEKSIIAAITYAENNYINIKEKLKRIKASYEWDNIITKSIVDDVYS